MSGYQPQQYTREGGLMTGHIALLSPWASYIDVEPTQWRRLYDWLLPPNHGNNDLYILHDQGQLLTVNPVYARSKFNIPDRIENPAALAETLYAQWQQGTVVILERNQYQSWLDDIQRDAWLPGDDLLAYGLKVKDCALRYAEDGIVLYPSPFDRWHDVPPGMLTSVGHALAPDAERRSVLFAVYDGDVIWTSLILGVEQGQVQFVTTLPADALNVPGGNWKQDYPRLVSIAETLVGPLRLGIFCERATFESLGISPAHWQAWRAAQERGDVISAPVPLSAFKISG
ncbi:MAG TPA: hypothetical protein PKD09_19620 [Aggregatilinea sp.]|jgi:hypothetical protein|uniref:hypothetical protein n=1 Tax=Aggregatilinea sp. TaxID=2806333 RepID=UPI002CAFCD81|nr:hypothetical protein [Aggregatilinea sp.]HML23874.1 hypothetical protein [Aggregatilinea sp.]